MKEEVRNQSINAILMALLLGIPGCGMALGDLGIGRTILDWILLGAAYFIFIGFLLGMIAWKYWYLASISTWGPMGVAILLLVFHAGPLPFRIVSILVPLGSVLAGAFLGSMTRARMIAILEKSS
jgi:hypothetical protein